MDNPGVFVQNWLTYMFNSFNYISHKFPVITCQVTFNRATKFYQQDISIFHIDTKYNLHKLLTHNVVYRKSSRSETFYHFIFEKLGTINNSTFTSISYCINRLQEWQYGEIFSLRPGFVWIAHQVIYGPPGFCKQIMTRVKAWVVFDVFGMDTKYSIFYHHTSWHGENIYYLINLNVERLMSRVKYTW